MALTSKTFDFLMENRLQNSRDWYQQHKDVYLKEVLAPLQDLSRGLAPYALQIDPEVITEPKVDRTISRVYRDTRFTRDKSLYRDVQWITFKRDQHLWPSRPSLFVEVSPDGLRYGCGWYAASPSFMETMRQEILKGEPTFLQTQKMLAQEPTYQLGGDLYKRHRMPQAPEELWDWLDRKNIFVFCEDTNAETLFAEDLADQVGKQLVKLAPVYQFFLHCTNVENQRQHSLWEEE